MDVPGAAAVIHSRPDDVSNQTFRHNHVRPMCVNFIICSRPRVGQFDVVTHDRHNYVCVIGVYRQRKDVNTVDGANEGRRLFVVVATVVGQLSVEQHDFVDVINSWRVATGREANCCCCVIN